MDSKENRIGAKKEMKDSQAGVGNGYLGKLYVAPRML